jgi:hypothetical protein
MFVDSFIFLGLGSASCAVVVGTYGRTAPLATPHNNNHYNINSNNSDNDDINHTNKKGNTGENTNQKRRTFVAQGGCASLAPPPLTTLAWMGSLRVRRVGLGFHPLPTHTHPQLTHG